MKTLLSFMMYIKPATICTLSLNCAKMETLQSIYKGKTKKY